MQIKGIQGQVTQSQQDFTGNEPTMEESQKKEIKCFNTDYAESN